MQEHDIATSSELDVALSAKQLRKHSQLWKVAEGRAFRWVDLLGLVCAILLFATGVIGAFRIAGNSGGREQIALVFSIMATLMVAMFLWSHMQRQLQALLELVKRLEQEALERRTRA